jgi:hypothetical protein
MDANAHVDALIGGHVLIALRHPLLGLDGTAGGIDRAAELDQ